MDSHASSECGDGRQARHLDVKVADLIEHESRLVRHPAAALLAYLLRHLPPLVEETGIDDAVRVPLVEHLDVHGRLPLDEVADRHAALGRHGAERPVREDAQGLLEGGHDVLARRRRPAVPEEVGRRRERRVRRAESADVVLEGSRRILRVVAGGPALDERGDARKVLLFTRDVGRADDEDAGGEHVARGLGEIGVLLPAEGNEIDGNLPGSPHCGIGVARLDGIGDEPDGVVPAGTRISRQIKDDDLVAELPRLFGRELKHLRFAGRDDVPSGRKRQVHCLQHLQLGLAGTCLSAGQSMRHGRIEPITLCCRAEDEAGLRRRSATIPEIVSPVEPRRAPDNVGVAVYAVVDASGPPGVLSGHIAEEEEKEEAERGEHERDIAEPCSREPEGRPHV